MIDLDSSCWSTGSVQSTQSAHSCRPSVRSIPFGDPRWRRHVSLFIRPDMPAGHWETLPDGLLAACLLVPKLKQKDSEECTYISAARATCRQWRSAVDSSVTQLHPALWPKSTIARFPHLRLLDLSRLQIGDSNNVDGVFGNTADVAWQCNASAAGPICMSHNSSSHDLLMGASALCCRIWASNSCDDASSCSSSSSSSNELDCFVNVRACNQGSAALTSYVASRWPDAVPHVTPAAALRLWKELPALAALQALAINGGMLLVQSVRTSVDHCPDAAAGLSALQHFAGDDCAAVSSVTITHTYTLQLPQAVCQLTGLQSLSIAWHLLTEDCSNSSSSAGALHGSGLALPGRRRSYEGPPSPAVVHVADPIVRLPSQFSSLTNLQQLCLAGSIVGAAALAPLSALRQLRRLALGPGELDMQALLHLRPTVVRQLQQLVLRQQGSWDARAVAAVFLAAPQLQELAVEELEVASSIQDSTIPPEQRLTEADAAPLAATLHTLHWATCTQRLVTGSSLLGRNTAAGAAFAGPAASHAPGSWFGGLTAVRQISVSGLHFGGAVLSAPVLEVLSSKIGSCMHLQQLYIHSLGVPVLPESLAQLPLLHTVSIASTTMARRMVVAADRALQVLGSCTGLRSLTLAGCELRALPPWLPHLKQLTHLQLQGNYLQDLPRSRSLGMPTSLRVLNLNDNRLRDIPAGVAALTNLLQLYVDENYLGSLPQHIWQLPLLQVLSVKENMLPQLPELPGSCSNRRNSAEVTRHRSHDQQQPAATAGGAQPAAASAAADITRQSDEEMALGGGGSHMQRQDNSSHRGSISHCSQDGSYSSNLKKLVLSCNQLCQLPSSISVLTALEQLDLDNNQLRVLPDAGSLWALTRLTALQLANNHLKRLPAGLVKLQRLVELDVSGNHLPPSSCPTASRNSDAPAVDADTAAAGGAGALAGPILLSSVAVDETCGIAGPSTPSGLATGSLLDTTSSSSDVWIGRPAVAPVAAAGASKDSSKRRFKGCRSISSIRQQLPGPLRNMLQLQQLRMGGQHAEDHAGHQCPLQLLLGGLGDLMVKLRAIAPPHHQCPVTRAAAAAVAHLTAATAGKRAKRQRQKELLQRVRTEPGWVVLPHKAAAAAGLAAGAAAAAGGGGLVGGVGKVGWPEAGSV